MKAQYAKITIQVMLVSLLAFLLVGCGESGSPGGDNGIGRTASISMAPGVESLPADGKTSTTLNLSMVDTVGDAVEMDTSVKVRTNLGCFRNGEKEYKVETIDDSGTVVVQFTSGTIPGTAEIWAESNDVKQKVEVMLYDPDKVGSLTLSTGGDSIVADGSSRVGIFATITDSNGEPIEGLTVNFETSLGTFETNNAAGKDASLVAVGLIEKNDQKTTAVTDVDGEAKVMLISGTDRGTANITVNIDGRVSTTTVDLIAGAPVSISLRAAPSTIKPSGTATLIATLLDANENPVEGETINFNESVNMSGGSLNSISVPTNVNGKAEVTYTAGPEMGEDAIRASTSSNAIMAMTTINVDPDAIVVGAIEVIAGSPDLVADGSSQTQIQATVTDIEGDPALGKKVNFKTTAGTLSARSVVTDENGIAHVNLQSSTNSGPAAVRAESDGFIGNAEVQFIAGPADYILLYAIPDVVAPNGAFETVAGVFDQNDNRLLETERVTFLVRKAGGTEVIDSAEIPPEDAEDGVYRFEWTAAYGPEDLEITARTSNEVSETVTVDVDPDAIRVGEITLESGTESLIADGNASTAIRATVLNTNGTPVQGVEVDFSTTLGTISPASETTDSTGIAEVTLKAGSFGGIATVTADAQGYKAETDVQFTAGTPGKVSIVSRPGLVKPGGTSTIRARLIDGMGNPIEGETLTFDAYINVSGGGLDSIQQSTDANGRATVEYTAGTLEGNDWIRVTSASNKSVTDKTCVRVRKEFGSINLSVSSPSIPADGTSSTAITATVLDSTGEPVPQGTEIEFETDLGSFSTNDGQLITRFTADDSGSVLVTLIASEDAGTAKITVTSGDLTQSTLVAIGAGGGGGGGGDGGTGIIGSISVDAGAEEITANGSSQVAIRATVNDTEGNPLSGVDVNFNTTLGTFVEGAAPSVTTNTSGIAEVRLQSSTTVGTATVSAEAGGFVATVDVAFVADTVNYIEVTAAPQTVNPGDTSTVTATVKDGPGANANPIEGETVIFNFVANQSGGSLPANPTAVTNVNGEATITYTAGSSNGTDRIRGVSTTNTAFSDSVDITVDASAIVVQGITVEAGASELVADGASSTTIRATVTDTDGNPAQGIDVQFSTTLGGLLGANPGTTNANGIAEITLTSASNTGIATLSAEASGFVATVDVAFVADTVNSIDVTAAPQTVNPGDTSTVTATVKDGPGANANPIEGETVTFNFVTNNSGGSLPANPTAVTNVNGEATITYTAGSSNGTDRIRGVSTTNTALSDSVDIMVSASATPVIIQSLSLTPVNTEIVADGTSNTALRAEVVDIDGNPVIGETVAFDTSYGEFQSTGLQSATTDTNDFGIAEVILTSAADPGLAVVMASIPSAGVSDQVEVNFVPGPPSSDPTISSITVQPSSIPADGTSTAEVTVTLADANNNPVSDGTSVSLYASMGDITSANPAPTASGRATFTITAPTTTGTADLYLFDYPTISGSLGFGTITSGDPSSILIDSVSNSEIAVTGVGKTDNTTVTVRVVDETNSTIANASDDYTLLVSLLAKPDGGEFLSGEDPGGGVVQNSDEIEIGLPSGTASFNLKSGILPGVVEIRLEVLDTTLLSPYKLSPPVVTVSPQISIASGPPHSMALSAPSLNAVANLNDGGEAGIPQTPGFYSRKAGLIVTDKYGNAVPDGTTINLGVLDTVISSGNTGSKIAGDSQLTDGSANFANDSVTRGGLVREIEPNDRVVLFDVVAADKSRFVTTPIGVTTLPVIKSYTNTASNIEYAVGASELGATIYGTDGTDATKGTVQTENGLGQLRLVYPANKNRILVGCYGDPTIDTRHQPAGSARVITVFTSSDENVSMVDKGTLCFSAIAGLTLGAVPEALSSDGSVELSLVDGGDEVPLPFVGVTATYTIDTGSGPINITFTDPNDRTDVEGRIISNIAWPSTSSGDSATITFYAGDATAEVTYEVP